MRLGQLSCCGIKEITGLSHHQTAEAQMKAFKSLAYSLYDGGNSGRFRYLVFSEAGGMRAKYGKRFAAFIEEHGLGDVVETGTHTNPNSGNRLKVWVWTINHPAVKAWGVAPVAKKMKEKSKEIAAGAEPQGEVPHGPGIGVQG